MTSKRPWMPLYIADYLAGTSHLEVHEHGAYLLLLMRYWDKGCLPDDEDAIRRISHLSKMQWKESRETIKAFFKEGWRHERIDKELGKVIEKSKVNSANAAKSHVSRRQVAAVSRPTLQTSHFTPPSGGEEAPPPASNPVQDLREFLTDAFEPSAKAIELATSHGLTAVDIETERRKFLAKYVGSASTDWDAAFTRWIEREIAWRDKTPVQPKAAPRIELSVQRPLSMAAYQPTDVEWNNAAALWAKSESKWSSQLGPDPHSRACRCPPEILRKHGINPATGLKLEKAS